MSFNFIFGSFLKYQVKKQYKFLEVLIWHQYHKLIFYILFSSDIEDF